MKHFLALLLLSCAAHAQNILVIVADDLGTPERPYLSSMDALAAQGITFTRCYSQAVCTPSRLEMQLGRYHRREGIGDLSMNAHLISQDRLPTKALGIAELMKPTHATALV